MEADDILKARSLVNRHLYQQRIADAAEAQLEQSQPTSYLNFDATTGLARLQDATGNIIYGAAQTNGAIGQGESIRLRRGGVLAKYDSMPRRKLNDDTTLEKSQSVVIIGAELIVNYDIYSNGILTLSVRNSGIILNPSIIGRKNINQNYNLLFSSSETNPYAYFPKFSALVPSGLSLKRVAGVNGFQLNDCTRNTIGVFADLEVKTETERYEFSLTIIGCPSEVTYTQYGTFLEVSGKLVLTEQKVNK